MMPLKVVKCNEVFIDNFCDILKQEGYDLISLEGLLDRGLKRKVLVGKVVKVFCILSKHAVIVLKEYLPSQEYGQNFKAVIHNELVYDLTKVSPKIGDRFAFLNPVVFLNPAFRTKYNRFEPKYSVDFGVLENSLMWFAKKEVIVKVFDTYTVTSLNKKYEVSALPQMTEVPSGYLQCFANEKGYKCKIINDLKSLPSTGF